MLQNFPEASNEINFCDKKHKNKKMKQKEIYSISVEVLTMKINEMMIGFFFQSNF